MGAMSIRMDSVSCRVTPMAASRPRRQFLPAVLVDLWRKALPMAGRRMCLSRGCEERRAHTIQARAWASHGGKDWNSVGPGLLSLRGGC